jgi:hypothetical protein
MAIADYYVRRAVDEYTAMYGINALAKARERMLDFQVKGDQVGADMWIRVIIALKDRGGEQRAEAG